MRIAFKAYDEMLPLSSLKKSKHQRNKHPQDQIIRLAKIMEKHGVRHPVHVSTLSGEVCFGHGRWAAAKLNKYTEYPIVYQDFESDEEEYACVQSDNAIAMWAELDLASINLDLANLGPDFDIDLLGIKDFVLEPADKFAGCDEDEIPEKVEATAKLGDIWSLGEHRLMCGDSKDISGINMLRNGVEIELLLTDPPYGMSVVKPDVNIGGVRTGSVGYKMGRMVGASKMHKAKVGVYRPIIGDEEPFDPNCCFGVSQHQIIFGANHFADSLPRSPHWIVWYKDMPVGTDFSGAELAWTSIDKKAVKTYKFTWAGMTREGNRKDELTNRVHPTQKPVGLFEAILKDYEYKTVLDLFGGSGSTLIACEKTNRKCFMMEIDEHYVDVIIARWEKYTGKKAELLNGNNRTAQGKVDKKHEAMAGQTSGASKVITRKNISKQKEKSP